MIRVPVSRFRSALWACRSAEAVDLRHPEASCHARLVANQRCRCCSRPCCCQRHICPSDSAPGCCDQHHSQSAVNAVLPSGVCSPEASGSPASGPIALHGGEGTVGTQLHPDYYGASLLGSVHQISLPGETKRGIAAVVECGDGGSAHWTSLWIFGGTREHLTVLAGPVGARHTQITDTDSGSIVTNVQVEGKLLVTSESFPVTGDCGGCTSGRSSTTWRWASMAPHHLLIDRPAPSAGHVLVHTKPVGNFQPVIKNIPGHVLAAGTTVNVVCTAQSPYNSSSWIELDTGAWIPSHDVRGGHLSDCDAGNSTIKANTGSYISGNSPGSITEIPQLIAGWVAAETTSLRPSSPPCGGSRSGPV